MAMTDQDLIGEIYDDLHRVLTRTVARIIKERPLESPDRWIPVIAGLFRMQGDNVMLLHLGPLETDPVGLAKTKSLLAAERAILDAEAAGH